jgi:hypothetical protein
VRACTPGSAIGAGSGGVRGAAPGHIASSQAALTSNVEGSRAGGAGCGGGGSGGDSVEEAVDAVMPLLLDQGLLATSAEVRSLA